MERAIKISIFIKLEFACIAIYARKWARSAISNPIT
jgi:hypothetical protein